MSDFTAPTRPPRPDPATGTHIYNIKKMSTEQKEESGFFISNKAIVGWLVSNLIFFIVGIVSFIRGNDKLAIDLNYTRTEFASHISSSDERYKAMDAKLNNLVILFNNKSLSDEKERNNALLLIKQIEIEVKSMNK